MRPLEVWTKKNTVTDRALNGVIGRDETLWGNSTCCQSHTLLSGLFWELILGNANHFGYQLFRVWCTCGNMEVPLCTSSVMSGWEMHEKSKLKDHFPILHHFCCCKVTSQVWRKRPRHLRIRYNMIMLRCSFQKLNSGWMIPIFDWSCDKEDSRRSSDKVICPSWPHCHLELDLMASLRVSIERERGVLTPPTLSKQRDEHDDKNKRNGQQEQRITSGNADFFGRDS